MAETCEQCGGPLADDQRYCLECGQRRGGPRLDYRHYMAATQQPAEAKSEPAAPDAPTEPEKPPRDFAPLAAVGGIAVLGLMLLVGVLIGKGNSDTAAAPAPQIVRVQGGGGEESGGEEDGSSKDASGGLGGSGAKKAKKAGDGGSGGTGNAVQASAGDLEALGNTSGEDYVKQSENLPNEIATPGEPPPIDKSTPPGGGEGGAEVIK
ncbi:MAG TPA: hypothetical protein VFT10_05885 [Solirubrobacterales bacterium]|nr:hypothetical protein [Solirubrobacterales bacterium]